MSEIYVVDKVRELCKRANMSGDLFMLGIAAGTVITASAYHAISPERERELTQLVVETQKKITMQEGLK